MSLAIIFKGPEGIAIAVDSRATLTVHMPKSTMVLPAHYDNATKLLKVDGQTHVAALVYGLAAIGEQSPRSIHGFLPEFDKELKDQNIRRLSVEDFAKKLSDFFMRKWISLMPKSYIGEAIDMLIGGFDENAIYGRIFEIIIPNSPSPREYHPGADFGPVWGGQKELVDRLMNGFDTGFPELIAKNLGLDPQKEIELKKMFEERGAKIPYLFLPLQDCIDLSVFLIQATITFQGWQIGIRGVGGAIDAAVITQADGFQPLRVKSVNLN